MTKIINWIKEHQQLFQLLSSLYLFFLVITILAMIVVVISLPQDYFSSDHRQSRGLSNTHPIVWHTLTFCKNLLGFLIILFGLILFVLPGQGILTTLVGLMIMNFPGKYRLERKLMSKPAVNKTLNFIRKFAKKPLLEIPNPENARHN